MHKTLFPLVFIVAELLLATGCTQSLQSTMKNYELAVRSGINGKLYPGEFNRLFPGSVNNISYYTGIAGPCSWTSQIGLHNRYVFRMQHTIELDSTRTNIVSTGAPTFYLYELPKLILQKNASYGGQVNQIRTFSADSWRRLVDAKGDFGVLGIVLKTNEPVENFDAAWRRF
jgi:hypothetical protein